MLNSLTLRLLSEIIDKFGTRGLFLLFKMTHNFPFFVALFGGIVLILCLSCKIYSIEMIKSSIFRKIVVLGLCKV